VGVRIDELRWAALEHQPVVVLFEGEILIETSNRRIVIVRVIYKSGAVFDGKQIAYILAGVRVERYLVQDCVIQAVLIGQIKEYSVVMRPSLVGFGVGNN